MGARPKLKSKFANLTVLALEKSGFIVTVFVDEGNSISLCSSQISVEGHSICFAMDVIFTKTLLLKSNELIKYSDRFDDPKLPGEMTTTIQFKKVSCGTELTITQEGVPSVIPQEMCYLGWQESLDKLKKLVEPIIPDGV